VVGSKAVLSGCIIGRGCKIGARVILTDVHIWDDVVIEEESQATLSVICSGCVVKKVCRS
jgi:NDP-sugar pyrophosphorylase family protein